MTLKTFLAPDGREVEFTTWGTVGQSSAVIAVTADKRIVIARQFRQGPERIFDELPGGGVDPGEKPDVAAARELLEETGYRSEKPFEYLGKSYRDAYHNNTSYYYLALDCQKVTEQQLGPNEHIEVVEITIEELIKNAKSAKLTDAAAVLMAYDRLMELNL